MISFYVTYSVQKLPVEGEWETAEKKISEEIAKTMKKTVKISLGGLSYTIDDDAFELLENYINTLKQRLQNDKEGKDIIQDIEERIAELISEKSGASNSVSIDVVKDVVTLGGAITDEESSIVSKLKVIEKNLDNAVKPEED